MLVPRVNLNDLKAYFRSPTRQTTAYAQNLAVRLFNFTNSALSEDVVNIFWGLRNLSTILEAIHEGTDTPDTVLPSDIQFSDRVEVLERLVHKLWWVDKLAEPQHIIFRTFGWACLIYIYTKLRELPKELGLNAVLASRIRHALEASPVLNVLLATFQDLLLWQMFICGRVADSRDRPFFAQQATKILMVRKLEDPADIVIAYEAFLWPERVRPTGTVAGTVITEEGDNMEGKEASNIEH